MSILNLQKHELRFTNNKTQFALVVCETTRHLMVTTQIEQGAHSHECVVCLWLCAMRGLMLLWDSETSLPTQPSLVQALYAIAGHRRQGLGHVPLISCQRARDVVTQTQPTLLVSWSATESSEDCLLSQWDKQHHYYCTWYWYSQTDPSSEYFIKSINWHKKCTESFKLTLLQYIKCQYLFIISNMVPYILGTQS